MDVDLIKQLQSRLRERSEQIGEGYAAFKTIEELLMILLEIEQQKVTRDENGKFKKKVKLSDVQSEETAKKSS